MNSASDLVQDNYDEKKDGFFTGVVPSSFGADMSLSQKVFLAQFEAIKAIADEKKGLRLQFLSYITCRLLRTSSICLLQYF